MNKESILAAIRSGQLDPAMAKQQYPMFAADIDMLLSQNVIPLQSQGLGQGVGEIDFSQVQGPSMVEKPAIQPTSQFNAGAAASAGAGLAASGAGLMASTIDPASGDARAPMSVDKSTSKGAWAGAGKGAAMGASVGSVIGPWGTVIGAGVGALGGAITGGRQAKKEAQEANTAATRMMEQQEAAYQAQMNSSQYGRRANMYNSFEQGGSTPDDLDQFIQDAPGISDELIQAYINLVKETEMYPLDWDATQSRWYQMLVNKHPWFMKETDYPEQKPDMYRPADHQNPAYDARRAYNREKYGDDFADDLPSFMFGGVLPSIDNVATSGRSIIAGGVRHSEGGIPMMYGDKKIAEIEREEIIFNHETTEKVESLCKMYESTGDESYLDQLGEVVRNEVNTNMDDLSGKFNL